MDFDSIPPGVDFKQHIRQTIARSTVVIAVIGPHWMAERSDGSRRIDDPNDFVRLEIEFALRRGIPVVPLLINNIPLPNWEQLPTEIKGLAFRNALPLDTGIEFHHHVDRLISGICEHTSFQPAQGTAEKVPTKQPEAKLAAPRAPRPAAIASLWRKPAFEFVVVLAGLTALIGAAMAISWSIGAHRRRQALLPFHD